MHGHNQLAELNALLKDLSFIPIVLIAGMLLFMTGLVPIPVGFERGKVKWVLWCGTGMHAHIVYYSGERGFQTLHPADRREQ